MARTPNIFTNPGNGSTYEWRINHDEEDPLEARRNIEHSAPTGNRNLGLIRQQGADSPKVLRYSGTILHRAQIVHMYEWFALCETRTIYFEDFAGDKYEVLITAFNPKRVRAVKNPADPSIPNHYWKYTIEMEVIRILDGVLDEADVSA